MAASIRVLSILLLSSFCLAAEGPLEKTHQRRSTTKAKRQLFNDVYLHSDLDLFQSGMLLALHHQPQYYHSFYQDQQLLQNVEPYLTREKTVHQYQDDLRSALKNPTKPVYHYTPLPKGTFPAPKSDEGERNDASQESNSDYVENTSYLFGYRVNDAEEALEMGRKEKMDGSALQGVYHVLLPDNRMQIVHYWSDFSGYHPTITYV